MAPATTQHSSPPQETAGPPKRSLRHRTSNASIGGTSSGPSDGAVVVSDRDGDLKGDADDGHAHDARGVNGVDLRKRKRSPSSSEAHREKRSSLVKGRETPEQMQFKQLVQELAVILTSGDSDPSVLRYPLPPPSDISVPPNGKRTKVESTEEVRTIASKLEANEYTNLNQLEEDLHVAAKGRLDQVPINTEPYNKVTSFFAFARDLFLNRLPPDTKQAHALRSSTMNGTPSIQIPPVRPPLREALYTMGPNGPLFTSIAARDISATLAKKLPPSLSLPTSTGGSFTASTTSIVPNNPMNAPSRRLADTSRKQGNFPHRKRGDFSDLAHGKIQTTKWLEWGTNASFAPDWDDDGVGGGYGAEGSGLDWAYRRLKKAKKRKNDVPLELVEKEEPTLEPIDENLLLEWTEDKRELHETVVEDENEDGEAMTIDETLDGLRQMIALLSQMQTLRMAMGKDIMDDERSLAENILTTFQTLILTYSIPPNALMPSLPEDAYNIITLTHPEFTGSLPPRKIPSWAPPPPLGPQQQPQQYPPRSQAQPRSAQQSQPSQRLLPGPSMQYPRGQPLTPYVRGPYNTPGSTPGGYQSSPTYQVGPASGLRGVGRPRKYDIRR